MGRICKSTGKPDKRVKRKYPEGCDAIGRPGKPIDWDKMDDLLRAGCTGSEVASYFDMHPDTFYDKVKDHFGICFTVYSQQRKQEGESILRAHQYAKALGLTKEGDNTLLIWLGKQRLAQRETPEGSVVDETAVKHFDSLINMLNKIQEKGD